MSVGSYQNPRESKVRDMRPGTELGPDPLDPIDLGEMGLAQILSRVVEEVRDSMGSDTDSSELLHTLLSTLWLKALLKVYKCLRQYLSGSVGPCLSCVSELSLQIVSDLEELPSPSHNAMELHQLLTKPHLQALLSVHDVVGLKDYDPVLPPLPETLPADGEAVRIVCLIKNNQPLGATIRRDEKTGEIYLARVIRGGLAERSGLLRAGDRLVEVNGHAVFGLEPEQIIHILARSQGSIVFKVVPIGDKPLDTHTMLYVRTLVTYDPHQDHSIPCADAGLAFRKGDLLEIVDQTDALWWQAKKLPCSATCASLIPSPNLLKRKQREFWWSQPFKPHTGIQTLNTTDEEDDVTGVTSTQPEETEWEDIDVSVNSEGIYLAGFRRSLRLCRRRGAQGGGLFCSTRCHSSFYNTQAKPYEEVVCYQRLPEDRHRLIALLGPSGVGVNELRRRLMEINPKIYQGATPHTTRAPRRHEESGREYHFISRDQFEDMLYKNRFLEYGEYRHHLYGTTVEAVKTVLAAGKICVIDIEPHAIESVRTRELKAYIIYIKPPPFDRLKQTRTHSQLITGCCTSRPFKDEDFQKIEEAGRSMEQQYCQFFDHVIVNDGLQASCVQLLSAVRRAQDEPQWVPASWVTPADPN
ncbi:MAGUK p55 subfamily member 4 [Brachyhypopomus gauderio]|uniref:MAGUK p55 subfamily member 4 n=1 Tax=Brachyhypopomus gauderio TaxID=698409 RepID=UPI00404222EE